MKPKSDTIKQLPEDHFLSEPTPPDSKEGLHTQGEQDLQICEEAIYRSWDYLMAMGHFTSPTDNVRKLENYLIQARVRILEVKNERKALLDAMKNVHEQIDLHIKHKTTGIGWLETAKETIQSAINNPNKHLRQAGLKE